MLKCYVIRETLSVSQVCELDNWGYLLQIHMGIAKNLGDSTLRIISLSSRFSLTLWLKMANLTTNNLGPVICTIKPSLLKSNN